MGKTDRGFTLIELLIVLALVGIVSSFVIYTNVQTSLKKARDATRKNGLLQLKNALEMYREINNNYPSSGGSWRGTCSGYGSYPTSGATGYIPNLAPTYMEKLPVDPRSSQSYPPCNDSASTCYLYRSDGQNYKLLAHCSPEAPDAYNSNNLFYDSARPTWAWQVHSGSGSASW